MYTCVKELLSRKRKGNLAIIVAIMVIIPVVALSMGQILLASESYMLRTTTKGEERCVELSSAEIACFSVLSDIEGKYLDEISVSDLVSSANSEISALLGNDVELEIGNYIKDSNLVQVKVICDNNQYPVMIIRNINLIEVESEDPLDESVRYIIDCSECNIERAVSYV